MVNGKRLAQTVVSITLVNNGATVTLIVLLISQPVAEAIVSVTEPAAVNVCPYILAGNWLAQTVVSITLVNNGATVTLIVLLISQPVDDAIVSVTEPA